MISKNKSYLPGIVLDMKLSFIDQPPTLFKTTLENRCFPGDVAKFLRTTFLQNTSGQLFLTKSNFVLTLRTLFRKLFSFRVFTGTSCCFQNTAQKKKFSIKEIRGKLRIWSHLQKKSLMENFMFLYSGSHDQLTKFYTKS